MSEHPLEDLDGIWSSEEEDEQDVQPEDAPIAGNVVDEITWQRTPQGTELLRIISALIEMPTSNEDVQRLAGHVHNVLHLTAQGFIKLLKGVLARCEATKSDPCMRLQETFGRVSNPCLYTVLLGGFAELQQRQRERGRAAGASESLTAGDGELPPDGGPRTRKCGFPNELDKLLRKSDVDLVIREFSLKMYQERRRWAQVHIKGDEDSKQRVSRGEAGAAARAPEDRRRSGRGTVGSQYDLPQHIAPAGMVETMERGPQPPPPPQQR
ncbi:hypothetical protein Vretifemale_17695 [Volvox reticuliferus]|uniref:Uncharacterized protein n=1 Tax=Volvox reticuliferus TaxID=1737510 RepID=A0A8J4FUU7_9CHLO|nr:hypothetical protein Vretifemale_17695 [Volvox reticuliferus]